ncbi:MAG: glycosyltransferase family 2 protein [Patescibacteria group bacterium]|jgi:hypothetical protein|nr:glycosyltransferase family 2 protein [Patescibacteria group bacterium]|tara:strand:- start:44408 stop:45184 length:777 start_codon:yes stop_codon:yes gene_type:complete
MDISIIIVSWNVKDLLKKCIESVLKYSQNVGYEIIVVDNASNDGTSDMIKQNFPQVKLITNKENFGFAKANNQGIRQSKGDYVLLLNPDTEFIEDTLSKVIAKVESDKKIGVLGCRLLNQDRTLQPSVRRFPTIWSQIVILLKLHKPFPLLLDNYLAKDFDYSREQKIDQVMGAFFLVRRSVFNQIGLLDEKFYIWFEEVDFCRRVWKAGYNVIYYPHISVVHKGGESFKQQMTLTKQAWFFRSMAHYFLKKKERDHG